MGYTHYWYRSKKFGKDSWNIYGEYICNLYKKDRINGKYQTLCYEYDRPSSTPIITGDLIRFNGKGDDGHETFHMSRIFKESDCPKTKDDKGKEFDFCKTAQKPYDVYVVAALLIAKYVFGNKIILSSDGDIEDLEDGKIMAESILNVEIDIGYDCKENLTFAFYEKAEIVAEKPKEEPQEKTKEENLVSDEEFQKSEAYKLLI